MRNCHRKRLREDLGRASETKFIETFTQSTPSIKQLSKKHMKHENSRSSKCVTVLRQRLCKGSRKGFRSKMLETLNKNHHRRQCLRSTAALAVSRGYSKGSEVSNCHRKTHVRGLRQGFRKGFSSRLIETVVKISFSKTTLS